ncbi:MAG: alpha-2-macroglobulin family protein [Fibrobacterota bacterium]
MKASRSEEKKESVADMAEGAVSAGASVVTREPQTQVPQEDLSKVAVRTNLNETAFFYPLLETNKDGEIIVKFQIPEALTQWRMMGFAHTQDLKYGQIGNTLVTQKDLMVMPNPPRFFRENDRITFTAKVSNLSDKELAGQAQLMLFDAATLKPVDAEFKNNKAQISFTAKKGQSAKLAWDMAIPEGTGAVTFRVVAKAGNFSDGEEQTVPVLSNSMMVTEPMPLSIRKKETKKFTFEKLLSQNNGSPTLRNFKLTLEFTSNPAWYAIQALPYMMEYPYECAEQLFSRFYANSIASFIANSSPRIKAVFDAWRTQQPEALLSNLEKNQELKSLVLEETPWLLDGKDESERKRRVALLFDLNKMGSEKERALSKLKKLQLSNGGWPWFEGMPDDRYITQYIATGMGRLEHLGMVELRKDNELWNMIQPCLIYLDDRLREDHEAILHSKVNPDLDHLSEIHIQYLYARSYFPDVPIADKNKKAFDYFSGQAKKYWLQKRRYMQGMIALALNRQGDKVIPGKIMKSLKENSIISEEMGMYWREMYAQSWYWYNAPIESQALMVEAFDEVAHDTTSVEDLKAWLLKSKQTQNWPTTRATAEACYALLLRGAKWLEQKSTVTITLGDKVIDAAKPKDAEAEAGTGYFKTSWSGADIQPAMGNITVTRREAGVAWGVVYWQYFERLDKITLHETPLKLVKKLFLEQNTATGPVITPVADNTALKPGDKLKVRIELRVDRDMEYVHMKDMRASGLEPLNVFSGYRWQDGLGYYESTRDAATHFFFGALGKGTYVFEYPLVATHAGDFSNGITNIECMYAPEFASHSEGIRVKVGR